MQVRVRRFTQARSKRHGMLSDKAYYKLIPTGLEENLKARRKILKACSKNEALQAAIRLACKQDILFYCRLFVWQYNPQHFGSEVGPFIPWPVQDEAIKKILWCIENRKDLRVAKSREMGASWMFLIVMDWLYQFHGDKKFLMISRNKEAVDAPDDSDSLFWKIDFMHDHLPGWLKPDEKRRKMTFKLKGHHAGMTGQASTEYSGSGGRAAAAFVDEFAKIYDGFGLLNHLADVSKCCIFNFTHTGLDTAAYAICDKKKYPRMEELRLHWSDHPEKNQGLYQYNEETHKVDILDPNYVYPEDFEFIKDGKLRSPWYDSECVRRGNESRWIAMNLDIDPKGSVSQFFDSMTIAKLKHEFAKPPLWEGDLDYDVTGKPVGFIQRIGGPLRLWCYLRDGMPPPESYGVGGDISTGSGATPSCLSVVNRQTGEKVAEYANAHVEPIDLASLAVALCRAFRDTDNEGAAFAWEQAGPGKKFGDRVVNTLGYRNIYLSRHEDKLTKRTTDTYGWYPSPDNKRAVLTEYRNALSKREFINRSELALEECLDFSYQSNGTVEHGGAMATNDPTGARVNHGDRVIADALAWMMVRGTAKNKLEPKHRPLGPGSLAGRRQMAENDQRQLQEVWE